MEDSVKEKIVLFLLRLNYKIHRFLYDKLYVGGLNDNSN